MIESCLGSVAPSRPQPGLRRPQLADIVLFHNTRDENGNGKLDDRCTHRGVVVDLDGPRVEFIYLRRQYVKLGVLNLDQPHRRRLAGRQIQNTFLRVKLPTDAPKTRYLAGQLLAGFITTPANGRGRL